MKKGKQRKERQKTRMNNMREKSLNNKYYIMEGNKQEDEREARRE